MKNKTKWIVLALLFIVYFLLQAMRQLCSASIPPIRSDLGLGAAPLVLGQIAERWSMMAGMSSLGLFHLLGAVAILFACRCRLPPHHE